ncbi:serine hydrolase [Brucella sp. BE17]|uniref:serine hydrolase domain-containing protein n=1 Tax=Brucella sp. BE17 TaxID=3142977 RepID=UPI0031BA6E44
MRNSASILFTLIVVVFCASQQAAAQKWQNADTLLPETKKAIHNYVETYEPTALMVISDGKVVESHGDVARLVNAASVRKSFLGALYGIAVAEGKINLDNTLAQLKIDDKPPLTPTEKTATVRDLLKARSGIYHRAAHETADMRRRRPERGSHAPGSFWFYNNWDFNALGTIYREKTGEDIFESFTQHIATPLDMQDYATANGRYVLEKHSVHPAYTFRMSARDMARFGSLYLNDGQWQGKQIVPAAWVQESLTPHSATGRGRFGYGYLWWTLNPDNFGPGAAVASGYGGQRIAVIPARKMVIVQTVANTRTGSIRTSHFVALLRQIAGNAP